MQLIVAVECEKQNNLIDNESQYLVRSGGYPLLPGHRAGRGILRRGSGLSSPGR